MNGSDANLLTALLHLVASEEGLSTARACKRLGLSRSELLRLLATLGDNAALGGLDLIRVESNAGRDTLWLTARARHPESMTEPLSRHPALRLTVETRESVEETLAEETPVALLFNGVPHVVMMCTPVDLEDFAFGFALSEGIVESSDELRVVELLQREQGLALHLAIPGPRFEALEGRRRNLVGRSGCGLCGAEALESAVRPVRHVESGTPLTRERLAIAFAQLAERQPLNRQCGALHAAAALVDTGLQVREDVGRHNALDKVIGALARSGQRADALLVTSRASYELVHKCAQAGVAILAAVSAPTAFAVQLAEEAGLTLIGFARDARMTVYAHPQRVHS